MIHSDLSNLHPLQDSITQSHYEMNSVDFSIFTAKVIHMADITGTTIKNNNIMLISQ